jgi:broad specificity phosphatase PhoE
MKKIILLFTVVLCTINLMAQENSTTTYFLIRHAEKDRTNAENKNPNLTQKGKDRAQYWNQVLHSVKFDAVYATNYNRTVQTAMPITKKNNLEIQFYNPSELYSIDFQENTKGKTVLIVGHSNTTPNFVNKIINADVYPEIDDKNNSNLYIVNLINNVVTHQLLKIEHEKIRH